MRVKMLEKEVMLNAYNATHYICKWQREKKSRSATFNFDDSSSGWKNPPKKSQGLASKWCAYEYGVCVHFVPPPLLLLTEPNRTKRNEQHPNVNDVRKNAEKKPRRE